MQQGIANDPKDLRYARIRFACLHRADARGVQKHIDSFTAQKIASTVWTSVSSLLYGKGKNTFQKVRPAGIVGGQVERYRHALQRRPFGWNGLILPVTMRANDLFVQESLSLHRVKYCRIVRKAFKGGNQFFLQLVLEGIPPVKRNNNTGMPRRQAAPNAEVGIDIGTSTVAVAGDDGVILKELFPEGASYDHAFHLLQRKRTGVAAQPTPANFTVDGTVKQGVKLTWVRSKNYMKIRFRLKDLYRRRAVALKEAHNKTANAILTLGNQVYVEAMDYRALMKRAKEPTVNKNGRFNRKKRYGKSIGYHAPAMLIAIVKQKAPQEGGALYEVDTFKFRASQYNHVNDTYIKKTRDERTTFVAGQLVQRDLYSAFLLKNSQPTRNETDRTKCSATFDTFMAHHDTCIQTLCQSTGRQSCNFGLRDFQLA